MLFLVSGVVLLRSIPVKVGGDQVTEAQRDGWSLDGVRRARRSLRKGPRGKAGALLLCGRWGGEGACSVDLG
jgi:hypothetical protein